MNGREAPRFVPEPVVWRWGEIKNKKIRKTSCNDTTYMLIYVCNIYPVCIPTMHTHTACVGHAMLRRSFMRRSFYRFPENSDQMVRFQEGCAVILKNGNEIYPDSIPEERWAQIECIGDIVDGISVTRAKQLLRKYGGSAWTEHYERDGTLFEVTEIHLAGNNSQFKYNHHL